MIIGSIGARWQFHRLLTLFCLLLFLMPKILALDRTNSTAVKTILSNSYRIERTTTTTTTTAANILSSQKTNESKHEDCEAKNIDETSFFSSLPYRIFAGALVVPITICAIFGNILVIYVIKHYHSLRITGNVFLASLAVADVGVSTLAMTFYGLQLVQGRWIFGAFMCRLWFSCDVLFSTASIIHLACIAFDRYLSIVRPFDHDRTSSERRRYVMIFLCWVVSALLSFIPIFTGIYTTNREREKIDCLNHFHGRCIFAVNQAYAIVSSSFSFWVPGAIMIIIYLMLIRIADKKEREAFQMIDAVAQRRRASQINQYATRRRSSDEPPILETTPMTQRDHQLSPKVNLNGHTNKLRRQGKHDSLDTEINRQPSVDLPGGPSDPRHHHMKHIRRERRAVKTLGAIMIAFIICWLPFFIRYSACEPDRCQWTFMPLIADIVFWVGYFNSMINPFLYAFHNRDFRLAFEKTLTKYFVCFRRCRRKPANHIAFPSTSLNNDFKSKNAQDPMCKNEKFQRNSNDSKLPANNKLSIGNIALQTSNGNLISRENSISSKCHSCL